MRTLCPGLDPCLVAQPLQGGDGRQRHRRRLLERQVGWFGTDAVFGNADVLGVGAVDLAEHLIAGVELGDVLANRGHPPGHGNSRNPKLRSKEPEREARRVWPARQGDPVGRVDRRRVDPDEHLAVQRLRFVNLAELENVGEPYVSWTIAFIVVA